MHIAVGAKLVEAPPQMAIAIAFLIIVPSHTPLFPALALLISAAMLIQKLLRALLFSLPGGATPGTTPRSLKATDVEDVAGAGAFVAGVQMSSASVSNHLAPKGSRSLPSPTAFLLGRLSPSGSSFGSDGSAPNAKARSIHVPRLPHEVAVSESL